MAEKTRNIPDTEVTQPRAILTLTSIAAAPDPSTDREPKLVKNRRERSGSLMKTVREVMSQDIITIQPSNTLKSASLLMSGHKIGSLPVVSGDALVGLLEIQQLLGRDPADRVSDVMNRNYVSVHPDLLITKAVGQMAKAKTTRVIVEEDGQLVGVLTHSDVLPEVGRVYDPLTNLPWSDTFREWAYDALASGAEISVIFFDLDSFGAFNKKYGHVIGDQVLKEITVSMVQYVTEESDILCRMGGDEFAIATIRGRSEAEDLAGLIQSAIARTRVEGLDEDLSASFGIAGGRRTGEREAVHFLATVDDLLNKASRACTRMKTSRVMPTPPEQQPEEPFVLANPVVQPSVATQTRLRLEQVSYSSTDTETKLEIRLVYGDKTLTGHSSAFASARSAMRLAGEACASAISQILPPSVRIAIEDVSNVALPTGESIIVSTVTIAGARDAFHYNGTAPIRKGDTYRAAAASVLNAINRPLGQILQTSDSGINN